MSKYEELDLYLQKYSINKEIYVDLYKSHVWIKMLIEDSIVAKIIQFDDQEDLNKIKTVIQKYTKNWE
jgi:hypothetical protein